MRQHFARLEIFSMFKFQLKIQRSSLESRLEKGQFVTGAKGIWEHEGNEDNTRFSTFLGCCQMYGVLYYSVVHGLGFFVCLMICR